MTGTAPAAVTYIGLPISSGGAHSLGRMSRRVAFEKTVAFLQTCTEPVAPITYSFDVLDVPELPALPRLQLQGKLIRRFGHSGRLAEGRVGDALDFLDEIEPQPTNQWGMAPVWFTLSSGFRIRDPATGRPLPGQDSNRFRGVEYEYRVPLGTSGLRLILHTRAHLGIELCLPDADDDLLHRVVPWLGQHLPCQLSPKQWRAWTSTKSGSFKARKLTASPAWLSAAR